MNFMRNTLLNGKGNVSHSGQPKEMCSILLRIKINTLATCVVEPCGIYIRNSLKNTETLTLATSLLNRDKWLN